MVVGKSGERPVPVRVRVGKLNKAGYARKQLGPEYRALAGRQLLAGSAATVGDTEDCAAVRARRTPEQSRPRTE